MKHYYRGHEIINKNGKLVFKSTGKLCSDNKNIACGKCGMLKTKDGHDACIGKIQSVMNACCGHGRISEAYIQFNDGRRISGKKAIKYFKDKSI